MGLIYMRISPSGKYYIGRTIGTEEQRWKEHVKEARSNNKTGSWLLNLAINKYGPQNFTVKILEDNITSSQLLQEREEYWIEYYDATNPDKGYNRSPGKGGHIAKQIQQYDLNGILLKEWLNIGEILKYYHWNERNLYDCLSGGYSHFHNCLWKYKDSEIPIEDLVKRYKFNRGKLGGGITIYCQETNEFYPSIKSLERALNLPDGTLKRKFNKQNEVIYNNYHYIKEQK